MKKHNNKLGDKIFALRIIKNISQDDLASKVGVSRQIVSKWEAGLVQPKADKLQLICEALGVGAESLMPYKETQEDKIGNVNDAVASNEVVCDEAIGNKVEESVLQTSNIQEENSRKKITRKKRKLSRKEKIVIVAVLLTIVMLLGIILIVFSSILDAHKVEGSLTEEISVYWNFSIKNIGWTLFSISMVITVFLVIILICRIVRNKKIKQEINDIES